MSTFQRTQTVTRTTILRYFGTTIIAVSTHIQLNQTNFLTVLGKPGILGSKGKFRRFIYDKKYK